MAKQQPKQKQVKETVMDLTPEDVAKIKAIVYGGKSDMLWMGPNRKEAKALIKLAEEYFALKEKMNV